ncbi:MAG: M20 metallopeptidase family protein [Alkaliphilus sp.]
MDIKNRIEAIYSELVAIRRDFHAYPELNNNEFLTQNKIMNLLNLYGIPNNKIANTGVVGIIKGKPGKTVALRAYIDALPIQEVNRISYASKNNNIMHACGHDVHTTVLLDTAKILKELKDEIKGQVKLMFQPAEETTGGALPMIKAGVLEDPKVNYVLGLHVMPYLEIGKIEIKSGQLNAASDSITITVKGKKGHDAYPHQGHDAIIMTSQLVMALQTLVSRNISPLDSCVLSIGSFHGGNKGNIICDEVVLKGTLRTIDIDTRAYAKKRITEIVEYQVKLVLELLNGKNNI